MTLSPTELAVLAAVHRADEEQGGLDTSDLDEDEAEALAKLVSTGLVEILQTAPDDDGQSPIARISWRGVETLRDAGIRR
ncbi:MAG TPA: hypothetical protein VIF62_38620 [Labilithrix sp.]|jgi:hypothetical protein